jgi:hypothetical protein
MHYSAAFFDGESKDVAAGSLGGGIEIKFYDGCFPG